MEGKLSRLILLIYPLKETGGAKLFPCVHAWDGKDNTSYYMFLPCWKHNGIIIESLYEVRAVQTFLKLFRLSWEGWEGGGGVVVAHWWPCCYSEVNLHFLGGGVSGSPKATTPHAKLLFPDVYVFQGLCSGFCSSDLSKSFLNVPGSFN